MEFPELGEHCSRVDCGKLDFLPVICKACGEAFCKDCYFLDAHNCKQNEVNLNCFKKIAEVFTCSVTGCKKRDLVRMPCSFCDQHFCLKCRHPDDHSCQKKPSNEAKTSEQSRTKEVLENIMRERQKVSESAPPKKPRNVKNQKLAAKVQLMRLKGKAKGDVSLPQEERTFFRILHEKGEAAIFGSNKWSIGRVLDSAARACNVDNVNNAVSCDDAKRVALYLQADGARLKESEELKDMLDSGLIFNGDTLILARGGCKRSILSHLANKKCSTCDN